MKFFASVLSAAFLIIFFTFSKNKVIDCKEIPALNKQILSYIKSTVKKKVGKGECWDLAAAALNSVGAKWDHDYAFGNKVNFKKNECVFPGDIIQFENVEIEYQEKNTIFHEELQHHTAIIYQVKNKGDYIVAQQNTSTHGKKVSLDPLNLKNIKRGSFVIYRPQK